MNQPLIEIRLRKISKTYEENELIQGVLFIDSKQEITHQGIILTLTGTVNLEISSKTHGRFEAIYNSVKPIQLINRTMELAKAGRLPSGTVEISFEVPLTLTALSTTGIKRLFETYRGVYVNISYQLGAEVKRSLIQKALVTQCDVLVQYKQAANQDDVAQLKPRKFQLNPQSILNVKEISKLPKFSIIGEITSLEVNMKTPITGFIIVEHCDRPIKSIELQLVRVETCGCGEGYAKDSTEIENLQMGDGDVPRNMMIPLYLLLPRIFTCPTVNSTNFRIDFEINVVVLFMDNHLVTESLPLKITRF